MRKLRNIRYVADWKRGVRKVVYPLYEARMLRRMPDNLPKHVGVMLDGNRRWARSVGRDSAHGHQVGVDNIEPLLGWCDEVGIEVVTLWLLSTDNLNRPPAELTPLLGIIEAAGGCIRWAPSTSCPRPRRRSSRPRRRPPATSTACWSTWPSGTAAVARSRQPSAHCSASTPPAARRWRSSPRSSTWSTSPSTSTPRASPTRTW